MKKNFVVDSILLITGVVVIVIGIMLDFHILSETREVRHFLGDIHKYVGYLMSVAILLHIAWHWTWLKNTCKRILRH